MSHVAGEIFNKKLLYRVYAYVAPYKKLFWQSLVISILLAVTAPIRPFLIKYTIDNHVVKGNLQGLTLFTGLMVLSLIIQGWWQYVQTLTTNTLGQNVIMDLRIKLFNHITTLRVKYFDNTPIGQLITRTVSDLETMADVFSEGLISILGDLLQIIVLIVWMCYVDLTLTFWVLVPLPLLIMATRVFQVRIRNAFQKIRTEVSNLNTFLQEHISGVAVIQYFAREDQEYRKFKAINKRHRDANIRSNWYYSIFFPVVELTSALSMALLIWYGGKAILNKPLSVTPGTIAEFILYINMLFRPVRELADKFNTLQMGMVGADRVFKVLDTKAFTPDNGTLAPAALQGDIEFNDVWFSYDQPEGAFEMPPAAEAETMLTYAKQEAQTNLAAGGTGTDAVTDGNPTPPDAGAEAENQANGQLETFTANSNNIRPAAPGPRYVLKGISFNVPAGSTVALVGATGAGKTSTINILNRFYEIQHGQILLDGIDIRDYKLAWLRQNIATVLQDVFLFSDTVYNNITLQNHNITMQQVVAAAKEIGAHNFIMRLPGGYNYNVMERGATLSAGQAQLISFVRAMVHNPSILVLDEATASVDTETELVIQHAIDKLMQGRTSVIIAHRLSTIQKADNIIVLDKGQIIEQGNHMQLLHQGGIYRHLYELQFAGPGAVNH